MTNVAHAVARFLALVQEAGIPVSRAYLFGSHAKGGASPTSDIDVCVISPEFGRDPIAETVRLRQISLAIDSRIEPIALSELGLEDRYSTLVSEIKRYGVPLGNGGF